jgi:hypothetical protein
VGQGFSYRVQRGEKGDLIPPFADRNAVNTPELALNSCDNLAQKVCELNGGTTDACMRIND